jgi:hypothetical protein
MLNVTFKSRDVILRPPTFGIDLASLRCNIVILNRDRVRKFLRPRFLVDRLVKQLETWTGDLRISNFSASFSHSLLPVLDS